MFAKHGFHNLAERVRLGKFIIERLSSNPEVEKLSIAVRLRMAFEELGPTFVKLGQVLATRPDLIPEEFTKEFEKLHAKVQPLPFSVIEEVLREEFGNNLYQKFSEIDPSPIGSASIAQVHKANLFTGEQVVIKVQRPGIIQKINDDLNVLYLLAELLETYVPETKPFNPIGIVDEFFKVLELETNFIVEANNIRRFQLNFSQDQKIKIPKVYLELSTERILVLEALHGIPLSDETALLQEGVIPNEIMRNGLRAYLKMVFNDGLFHGDLHAGNFFIMSNNVIGLIDFGVVGRLNKKTQTSIANMILALAKEDYERLALEYVDIAPFTDQVDVDRFAKDLRELIAPYFGLTLKNINLGHLLMSSASIAGKHHLTVPTELMLFFKSIVAIEGVGRKIMHDFDFLQYSIEIATDLAKKQFETTSFIGEASQIFRESKNLISGLPRQLNFLIRKLNSPQHAFKMHLFGLEDIKKSIESSFNLIFLGIIIASLILSGSIILVNEKDLPMDRLVTMSFIHYGVAGFLGVIAFINYIRKP